MKKVSILSRHHSHKDFEFPLFDKAVRIRFGSLTEKPTMMDIEINTSIAINNCSNKEKMKEILIANGIKTPIFEKFDFDKAKFMLGRKGTLGQMFDIHTNFELIFKEKRHSRGEGIVFVKTLQDLQQIVDNNKAGYLEQVIDNHREFRVHVCGGKVIWIDEKLPREENNTARIKNLANGYKYRSRPKSRPIPSTIIDESIKAVTALGLDFGAVDIAIGVNREINVFEVNSAPGLRTRTKKIYNDALINLIISRGAAIVNE